MLLRQRFPLPTAIHVARQGNFRFPDVAILTARINFQRSSSYLFWPVFSNPPVLFSLWELSLITSSPSLMSIECFLYLIPLKFQWEPGSSTSDIYITHRYVTRQVCQIGSSHFEIWAADRGFHVFDVILADDFIIYGHSRRRFSKNLHLI